MKKFMREKIKFIEEVIARATLSEAKHDVKYACQIFFYQPKVFEKAKKLRKF